MTLQEGGARRVVQLRAVEADLVQGPGGQRRERPTGLRWRRSQIAVMEEGRQGRGEPQRARWAGDSDGGDGYLPAETPVVFEAAFDWAD